MSNIILKQRLFGDTGNFFQEVSKMVKNRCSVFSSSQEKIFLDNNPCRVINFSPERCKRFLLNPELLSPEEFKNLYDEDLPQELVVNYDQVFFNYETDRWEGFDKQTDVFLPEQVVLNMLSSPPEVSVMKKAEEDFYITPIQQFSLADTLSGKEKRLPFNFSFEDACRELNSILTKNAYPTYQAVKLYQFSLMATVDGTLYVVESYDFEEQPEHSMVYFPDLNSPKVKPFNSVSVNFETVKEFWL